MPYYNPIIEAISREETKRYAGIAPAADFPTDILENACIEAQILSSPKAAWQIYDYHDKSGTILNATSQQNPSELSGRDIIRHLSGAVQVAIMAVTIGCALENKASEHFTAGDYTKGLILDAAGTTAVEAAADKVNSYINKLQERLGLAPISRFSPGYGDWDIKFQPRMLELSGGNAIGISATETCMLLPRKSITAIIGFTPKAVFAEGCQSAVEHNCAACPSKNCYARKGNCLL